MPVIYFDIETVADDTATAFLREVRADARLKDEAKILADIAAKVEEQAHRMALDPYACRIVAMAWMGKDDAQPVTWAPAMAGDDLSGEALMLSSFFRAYGSGYDLCGYNVRAFDLPVIVARARLLGVRVPDRLVRALMKRYDTSILDLYEHINLGQYRPDGVISRSLTTMCARHGIDIPSDDIDGAGVAAAVREGRWDDIREHVTRDVLRTRALADRLGVTLESWPTDMAGVR